MAVIGVVLMLVTPGTAAAADTDGAAGDSAHVVMVTWRGCEDACRGFMDYVDGLDVDVEVTVLDAGQDRELLPAYVAQVEQLDPDLLVTWGTSVTLGMIGTPESDPDTVVTETPTVFMIVADPVGAGIIEEYGRSGRPMVTGTHNRVPEETQMRVLADYLPFSRVGVIYNTDELNAVLKAEEIKRVAGDQGFEVVERVIEADANGAPLVDDIPQAVADIAAQDVDLIYVGSSSFLLENTDPFTSAALAHGLPVATAYEAMVRESQALIALASAYYNVGQLAGFQAEQILEDGREPGDLEVVGLDRFSVLINIDTARELELYPPMLLMRYAEIVDPVSD
jgi:putative ABC transport system substrate-binding protein